VRNVAVLESLVLLPPVSDIFEVTPLDEDLGSPTSQGIHHRFGRVSAQSVKVSVVEEELESSIDGIPAFREKEKVLRSGQETVVGCGLEEGEVAFLEDKWWPP
jgi:hypothetical protein